MISGACLCGAVAYRIARGAQPIVACHCTQCRKVSGHFWASCQVPREALDIHRDEGLRWFRSSPGVRRGFCGACGAALFWEREAEATVAVGAGTLDAPTGLALVRHIYVADKGDYYDIADGLPQE